MERITTWNRKHVLLADALYAVIISIFFTLMAGTNDSNPGIIAYFDHTVMAFWSFVLMVPVAMRRWKPPARRFTGSATIGRWRALPPSSSR